MEEQLAFVSTAKEEGATIQVEAFVKVVDDNIVNKVIIDLINTGVMNESPEVSNAAIADEVVHQDKEYASNQSTTLNEAMLREKGAPDAVIVYSTSSSPTPLNYARPSAMTRDQVQKMIGQAMDFFFQRQRLENDQFRISMQNTITTQFSNLDGVLLQNLQVQMTMLGVIAALAPLALVHQPPPPKPTPPYVEPTPPLLSPAPPQV